MQRLPQIARSSSLISISLRLWLIPAYFLALTIAVTWPLALQFQDRVPGFYVADNYEYLWKIWWFEHTLIDLGTSPLHAPDIFYPQGFDLAHAELTPLHTIVGLPITVIWDEVVTYNAFAFLSFFLGGWATFRLVHYLTRNPWSAILAGTVFALSPYHVVRYGGILPLMAVEGLPVFFLGVELWLGEQRLRWAVLAAFGYALSAWASLYYAFGLGLLGTIYILWRLRQLRSSWPTLRVRHGILIIGSLALLFLLPAIAPQVALRRSVSLAIPLEDVDFWSASLTDYVLPPGLHPWWGAWIRDNLLGVPKEYPQLGLEFVLGVGFVSLLFALFGLRHSRLAAKSGFLLITLTAMVLSWGPRLHVARHPLLIPASQETQAAFNTFLDRLGHSLPTGEGYPFDEERGLTIPLPALFLRWLIPPLAGLRAWNRFAVFVSFGVSVLAGLGHSAWMSQLPERSENQRDRSRLRRALAGTLFVSLATFELWPAAIPLQPIQARPVDDWLARQPGQFTIMELPLTSALSAPQMLYTRYHSKRIAFAYGTSFPYYYRERFPELAQCPEQACLDRLRSWQVRYVLVNLDALPLGTPTPQSIAASPNLARSGQFQNIVVYELLDSP